MQLFENIYSIYFLTDKQRKLIKFSICFLSHKNFTNHEKQKTFDILCCLRLIKQKLVKYKEQILDWTKALQLVVLHKNLCKENFDLEKAVHGPLEESFLFCCARLIIEGGMVCFNVDDSNNTLRFV